ncbi:zinc-dependent peptidase [Solimonas soli]|uniref:M90 family metallopeptidase n=1 Tax=Solimonas soli TaxID=413479 RepID=UPI000485C2D0|nr:M90 family metallopeptidase [Solimonas soli]
MAVLSPLIVACLLVLAAVLHGYGRHRARQRKIAAVPERWRERIAARVPQAAYVPPALEALYAQRVQAFLRDKRFVGCDGFVVDDEHRLIVAGLVGLLLLRDDAEVFPPLRSVLLYPAAFLVPHDEPDELGLVDDEPVEQIGESWQGDRVILSWQDVEAALRGDAVNVVVHEFAHQLDDENPWSEGAPRLAEVGDYAAWSQVMQREYERLQRHRRPPVLDPYGAESPGEFFGVVSEAFFQQPQALRRHHAELYALLAAYYRLDPAARPPPWP